MVLCSYLQSREHSSVDTATKVATILAIEDHASTWTTKRFVSGCGDNITMLEWGQSFLCGNQTTDVCHVHHQQGTVGVSNGAEPTCALVLVLLSEHDVQDSDTHWYIPRIRVVVPLAVIR